MLDLVSREFESPLYKHSTCGSSQIINYSILGINRAWPRYFLRVVIYHVSPQLGRCLMPTPVSTCNYIHPVIRSPTSRATVISYVCTMKSLFKQSNTRATSDSWLENHIYVSSETIASFKTLSRYISSVHTHSNYILLQWFRKVRGRKRNIESSGYIRNRVK